MNFWQLFRFQTFYAQLGEKLHNNHGHDLIFLLKFLNVLYMAVNWKKIWIVHLFKGITWEELRQKVVWLLCSNKFWLTQSPSSYPTPWKTSADFSKFSLILHDQKKLLFTNNMLTLLMRLKASPKKSLSCDFIIINFE